MSEGRARRLRRRRSAGASRPVRPRAGGEATPVRLSFDLPAPDPAAIHVQMRMRLPVVRRVRAGADDPLARAPHPDAQRGL